MINPKNKTKDEHVSIEDFEDFLNDNNNTNTSLHTLLKETDELPPSICDDKDIEHLDRLFDILC